MAVMTDYDRTATLFARAAEIPREEALAIIYSVADALTEREEHS